MDFTKMLGVCAAAAVAISAYSDAANALVSFSTTRDYYADGRPVADGEWYALCWSGDGAFDGLKLDGTPVNPDEVVCAMMPLAKGGRCPFTVFQIDSGSAMYKQRGAYTVVLLDTRGADGKPAKTKPTAVQAAVASAACVASGATAGGSGGTAAKDAAWTPSEIDETVAGYRQPVIKNFKPIDDATVRIDVEGLMPNVRYTVKMGASVNALESYGVETKTGDDKATFFVQPGDAKFFQIVREPLGRR